jgi:hypothetical protein
LLSLGKQTAPGVLRLALEAFFFATPLNVADTTSESRRDGVSVAQDVKSGRESWGLEFLHLSDSKEAPDTKSCSIHSIGV